MSCTCSECSVDNLAIPKGADGEKGASVTVGHSILATQLVDAGTPASTTETDLFSYSLNPVTTNALLAVGDSIVVKATFTMAANGNTKNLRVKLGTTTVDTLTTTANGLVVMVESRITRVTATSQVATTIFTTDAVAPDIAYNSSIAENLGAAVNVRITGENGSATLNDIVLNNVEVSSFKTA